MADLIDKVTDLAKKLRKSAKKCNDPVLQELITDLNLSVADLKVQLAEQRQAMPDTTDATEPTATRVTRTAEPTTATTRTAEPTTASRRVETLSLSPTTTQLPDIGDLRKFPD